jgi:tetratricopeptide (TPR) repeat protein
MAGNSNIINDARAAVQRRDGALAQRLLAELRESEMPWLLMAQACNLLGNVIDEEAALQRLLALEPRNLPALILLGELKAKMGDDRAANAFFQAALNQAATTPNVPAAFHPMLNRARDFIGQVQVKFEQHLIDGLKQAGLTRVQILDQRMPLDYCEDCGAPLFPNTAGESVHAEMPETESDSAPMHLH